MRFKLDENLPRDLADNLLSLGHESDTVHDEGLAGAEDAAIVHAARTSSRILMTLDKGIASLLQYPVHGHCGVVLFRPDATGRRAVLSFVRTRLSELLEMELVGRLTVVGANSDSHEVGSGCGPSLAALGWTAESLP
jgi:predicted nuclease of predicted toxin-antitoxin system